MTYSYRFVAIAAFFVTSIIAANILIVKQIAVSGLPLPAAIWGLTGSGIDIGLFAMMMALSPEDKRPRFIAATYVLSSVTSCVGPLLGAALAEALDVRTVLLVGGALQIATASLLLWLPRREEIMGGDK